MAMNRTTYYIILHLGIYRKKILRHCTVLFWYSILLIILDKYSRVDTRHLKLIGADFIAFTANMSRSSVKKCTRCQLILEWIHLLWRPGHLTPWTLTPEFWPLTPHLIPDAPDLWRQPFDARVAFDSPIIPRWHLTPQYPWVAFDAPIPLGGIWRPNNLKWHLTPQ